MEWMFFWGDGDKASRSHVESNREPARANPQQLGRVGSRLVSGRVL